MIREVHGYCGFCAVHCPVVTAVEGRRVLTVKPDPSHPLGGAICGKGRAAPEFHDYAGRVNVPLRRTRPKTDPDPGWRRCTWDEALGLIASRLLAVRAHSGPEAVAFTKGTIGGTGLTDTERWLSRLANHFGTPNTISTTHLCQWPRDTGGAHYTFGTPALPMPDVPNSRCVVLWGANPSANFLSLGRDVIDARARGAKLLVIDPRRVGLANRADLFLQIRPGTDGALALGLIHLLIRQRRYDDAFVREWTNAPLLVRDDSQKLLSATDVVAETAGGFVAVREGTAEPVLYDPATGTYAGEPGHLALRGAVDVRLVDGRRVTCRPVFDRLAAEAAAYPPAVASEITAVPASAIEAAAGLLAENRPVSHYFHNGLVQHTNATQACRAIEVLYALIGDFDRPGGNVVAPAAEVEPVMARAVLPPAAQARRLGRRERPIGPPSVPGSVTAYDLYRAILDADPYPVRALVGFGANLLLANGDSLRGRAALERLEFFAQIELVHTPTSRFADVLLPATSWLESSALKIGHRYPIPTAAWAQFREPATEPLYERRADVEIIFDLACRLGLGEHFWNGEVAAGYDALLKPSGLSLDELRARRHGRSLASAPVSHRKYAVRDRGTGIARGFDTPTRKVEIFAVRFADHGLPPLPVYREPALSPRSQPALAREFPLVLTNAKRASYLHSQHRGLPSLRKTAPNPTAEIHPDTAREHGIAHEDWLVVETPSGAVRAQAHVTDIILPGVVCCSHGWWEACPDLGLPGFDPFTAQGANQNLLVLNDLHDPISGGTPHRSSLCRISRA